MNLSIGSRRVSSGSNISALSIGSAVGIAVAISAAVALVPSSNSRSPMAAPAITAAIDSAPLSAGQLIYYLVDSQQDAAALQSAISSEQAEYGNQIASELRTVVVATPEDEFLAAEMTRELMHYAPQVRVVDARHP